jgi:FtsP/CotA-like multicopper oxidase with cupredoxin domain
VRRSALHAPLALVLLVAATSLVGVAASKGLPTGATGAPQQVVRGGVHHHSAVAAHGYPGSAAGTVQSADVSPTAYGEPKVITSHNGVLRVWFKPHDGKAKINGKVWGGTRTFTGTFPGPTLHVNPGDTIDMKFTNLLSQVTNLHFHGFRVSPSGLADNVLRTIAPAVTTKKVGSKKTVRIVVHIPADHEQGLYWYHPHFHGLVDAQVYPGLAGMIVVGDVLRQFPWLDHIKRRTMALQSVQFGDDGNLVNVNKVSSKQLTNLVNGHYQPTLRIRPGEVQLWQVANISNEHWYKLFLGGQKLHVIGEDGNPVGRTWSSTRLLLAPAKRFSFLVVGPKAGSYTLKSLAFNQGFNKFGEYTLAQVVSAGKPVKPLRIPTVISPSQAKLIRDVRNDAVSRRRVLTFSIESPFPKNSQAFKINGKLYNPRVVNERVHLGQTEEWLLRNTSSEDHPFHIHTNDFLVEQVNGHKVAIHGFQDTVKIPFEPKNGKPGTVLIRQRYRKFQGEAVFHCHILFHEDNAMMGNILFGPRVFNPSFGK